MFGNLIAWVLEQIQKIIESKNSMIDAITTGRLEADSNKILDDKLKFLKAKLKRDKIRDKISELEEEEFEEEEDESESIMPEAQGVEDTLLKELLLTFLGKLKHTPNTLPVTSPKMTPEVIEIIKKAKSYTELIPLAKKYFPTFDEETIKTVWESFR